MMDEEEDAKRLAHLIALGDADREV